MEISFTREDFAKYSNSDYFEKIVEILTVNELLEHIRKNYLGLNAIGKEDGSIATFDEFLADVNKVCYYLSENKIEPKKHIGILAPNGYSFAVSSVGVMAYGCVAVLLPPQLDKQMVFGCSKKYDLAGLIYAPLFTEKVELITKDVFLADSNTILQTTADKDYTNKNVDKDDSACIIMTGGTTGKSKGAVLSHDALMCGMINGAYALADLMHEVYYCLMPLTHVFGFIRNFLTSLYTGSLIYFNQDKRLMFNEFKQYRPTGLVIVPALAELFLNLIKAYGIDMLGGNLKFIICGAASVPPYLISEYHKLGINFCPGYGLTEFSNMVSGNPEGMRKPDSVGLLYPHQTAKVVGGELWLKGRNMMKDLIKQTNNYLANIGVMYIKLHNLHWNVVGPSFKQVHEYLETLYDYFATILDEVAEFIKMDEAYPLASLSEFNECATIPDIDSVDYKVEEALAILLDDIKTLKAQASVVRTFTDKVDKFQLGNMIEDQICEYDKMIWFITSMKK